MYSVGVSGAGQTEGPYEIRVISGLPSGSVDVIDVGSATVERVVLARATEEMAEAAAAAGAESTERNGTQLFFRARPERRLDIIRAIERAGGKVEEFHTESPDWEELMRRQIDA